MLEPRFLKIDDIASVTGFKRTAIYQQVKDGLFPRPIRWGKRASRWIANEVNQVFDARAANKTEADVSALVAQIHAKRPAQVPAA